MWKNPVNSQSESIRIRLPYQLEQRLIAEKNRTGKSVSQIAREALHRWDGSLFLVCLRRRLDCERRITMIEKLCSLYIKHKTIIGSILNQKTEQIIFILNLQIFISFHFTRHGGACKYIIGR